MTDTSPLPALAESDGIESDLSGSDTIASPIGAESQDGDASVETRIERVPSAPDVPSTNWADTVDTEDPAESDTVFNEADGILPLPGLEPSVDGSIFATKEPKIDQVSSLERRVGQLEDVIVRFQMLQDQSVGRLDDDVRRLEGNQGKTNMAIKEMRASRDVIFQHLGAEQLIATMGGMGVHYYPWQVNNSHRGGGRFGGRQAGVGDFGAAVQNGSDTHQRQGDGGGWQRRGGRGGNRRGGGGGGGQHDRGY